MANKSLGTILVFLNLVFSILAFFLIIQVYATRTSWKSAYDKLNGFYTVSEANNKALRADCDAIKQAKDEEIKKLQGDIASAKKDKDLLEAKVQNTEKELQAERTNYQ